MEEQQPIKRKKRKTLETNLFREDINTMEEVNFDKKEGNSSINDRIKQSKGGRVNQSE